MSQFGQRGGVNIFQKCLKFKNVPNVGGGGEGATLIGTLSQIFSFFFSDASPNKSRPRIRIVGSPQGSNGVDKATKTESVSGISKHASSVAPKLLEEYASDDDFTDLSQDKDEYETP